MTKIIKTKHSSHNSIPKITILKQNSGFTLIELVAVITILSILSASAAPKFMDLKHDATVAKLQALKGTIQSSMNMSKAKMVIQNTTTRGDSVVYDACHDKFDKRWCINIDGNTTLRVKGGYPDSSEIYKVLDNGLTDQEIRNNNFDKYDITVYTKGGKDLSNRCQNLSATKCNKDWCFCDKIQNDIPSIYKKRFGPGNVQWSDVAVFWPKGYTFDGKDMTKGEQCFLMYQQVILEDEHDGSTIIKYPSIVLITEGC